MAILGVPMKRLLAALLLLASAAGYAQSREDLRRHTLTGTIKTIPHFESKILGNSRDILVYLPPNYESDKANRFPVLYLQDGQNVFDGATSYIPGEEWHADEAAEALIHSKLIEPLIIVAIPNAGAARGDEYLPTRWTPDPKKVPLMGGKADLYGRMVVQELMPLINATYRTKTGPKNTAIAGSSLGAILSLHLGITRSNVFGKLGLFSPSLWWQDHVLTKAVAAVPRRFKSKIWLDIGTEESKDALPDVLALKEVLLKKDLILGKDFAVYVDGYAHHNERAWATRFPAFLLFMYGTR